MKAKPLPKTQEPAESALENDVAALVDRYISAWKKTAAGYIEMGAAINDAHGDFGAVKLERFYRGIGLVENDSTSSKLRQIGKKQTRLLPVAKDLPSNWTTLYELARLEDTRFEQLLTDGVINPKMTLKDIQTKKSPAEKDKDPTVRIRLKDIDKHRRAEFAARLGELLKEFELPQWGTLEGLFAPNDRKE